MIDLGPLADDAAVAIAVSHLGEENRDIAVALVREADGSPLFLIELTRGAREAILAGTFADYKRNRLERLP